MRVAAIAIVTVTVFALVGPGWGWFALSMSAIGFLAELRVVDRMRQDILKVPEVSTAKAEARLRVTVRDIGLICAVYSSPYVALAFAPSPGPVVAALFASGAMAVAIGQHLLTPRMALWSLPVPTLALSAAVFQLAGGGWAGAVCAGLGLVAGSNGYMLARAANRLAQDLIDAQIAADEAADNLERRVRTRTAELEAATREAEAANTAKYSWRT
jgi:hypothetical protein